MAPISRDRERKKRLLTCFRPTLGASIDVNSDLYLLLEALTSLHVPLPSSHITDGLVEGIKGGFFEVPPERIKQKSLYFRRWRIENWKCASPDYIIPMHGA